MHRFSKRFFAFLLMLCICVSLQTAAFADDPIDKVTTVIDPNIPIAMDSIGNVTAHATMANISVGGPTWYDSNGNIASGAFTSNTYTLAISVYADPGYYFSDGVAAYINNEAANVSRSEDGTALTISRQITPLVYGATIYKNPQLEKVDLDQRTYASFNATASPYYIGTRWQISSPDGKQVFNAEEIDLHFPSMSANYSHDGTTITIHGLTENMDGWKARCGFINADNSITYSNYAEIKILKPTPSPTPEPTPTPTPAPTPEPTPEPTPTPAQTEEPSEIQSVFSEEWSYDDADHWHAAENTDEIRDLTPHDMQTDKAKKLDVCSVCGYSRPIEKGSGGIFSGSDKNSESSSPVGIIIGVIAALAIIAAAAFFVVKKNRKPKAPVYKGKH